jgi:redox-sensing transcriptional repressor
VGYEVGMLAGRLTRVLGLDREHRLVLVGAGNLGRALAHFLEDSGEGFQVVAVVDKDPAKVGSRLGAVVVRPPGELRRLVQRTHAEIGVLAVPVAAAQENYDALVEAGIRAVLNFAATNLKLLPGAPAKNVDLRIHLEELAFLLRRAVTAGDGRG